MKPKIALIVDTDSWAFYNRSIILSEKLKEYFEFKIIPATTALNDNVLQTILLVQDCDLVHFFWRGLLFSLENENVVFKRNEIDVNSFLEEKFTKMVKTTCVPDHSLLDEEYIEKTKKALNLVDGYYTMSGKLFEIYQNLDCKKPQRVILGGVEPTLFPAKNLERFETNNLENRSIILGWNGNSQWGSWDKFNDFKGVHTIIKPAVEELKEEGYPVELLLADRSQKNIPIEEMKDFYNAIDIYICASKTEGGPNQVLESMCSGVPIISTDVGYVCDVLGQKQKEFVLQERTKEALKEKIKDLLNNKQKFKELSEENINESKKYYYDVIAMQFKEFFDFNLKRGDN